MLMSINKKEIVSSKSNESLDENQEEIQFSVNKQRVFKGSSAIHALSHCLPDTIVTATEIQDAITAFPGHMLDIERRTGMKEKRVFKGDESVVDHALKAIDNLKKRGTLYGSKIPMDEIDLIIYFGVSRHYAEPATAVLIQHELGLNGPMAFDVSNACLGFTDAMCIADSMIASKRIRYALLVSAEKVSFLGDRAIDEINSGGNVFEQFASLTVSDGAVAILVGPQTNERNTIKLKVGFRETHSEYSKLCFFKDFSSNMISYPKEMFNAVNALVPDMLKLVLDAAGWHKDDIYKIIAHQASNVAAERACEIIGMPPQKAQLTFPTLGNNASVALPMAMSIFMDEEINFDSPRRLLSFGFGSGLGFGILAFEIN